VSLFRRKNKEGEVPTIVQLYRDQAEEPLAKNREIVQAHLQNLHRPGGVQEEKKKHDFVELAMPRPYMDAMDNVQFTIDDQISSADQVATRWTARGIHRRELLGLEPSGEEIAIAGVTVSVVKYERVRQEWTFWDHPELTRRLSGEAAR
jgi:predicted ester cyclase